MIFDCFTFFNELDILDIRLNEMAPVVDRFVLVEARKTFQGADKPLYFDENKDRFAPFLDKIEHIITDFPDDLGLYRKAASPAWAREYYQRDQIAQGLKTAKPDDLVIVSDVDEIIRAESLQQAARDYRTGSMVVFSCPVYSFYFNRRLKKDNWYLGPRLCSLRSFRSAQDQRWTKLFASRGMRGSLIGQWHTRMWNKLNTGFGGPMVEVTEAGWHFTSIGGWEAFRAKMQAFAHEEQMDLEIFKQQSAFQADIENTTVRMPLADMPRYLQDHRDRFGQSLDLPA
jgi:beta-1,4-mannosyl-glycoprotein beta-1,4-N-acetylglucosaminyltransferase